MYICTEIQVKTIPRGIQPYNLLVIFPVQYKAMKIRARLWYLLDMYIYN